MIQFTRHSGIYILAVQQQLPIPVREAWDFFSSPKNLEKITPSKMSFRITSGALEHIYSGQIITYKVAVFPGITANWVTEITHVEHERFFVDEQRCGPYQIWHHEHRFDPNDEGVLVSDNVSYKIPLGVFGHLAQSLFIKKQLKNIFEHRMNVLAKKFGK